MNASLFQFLPHTIKKREQALAASPPGISTNFSRNSELWAPLVAVSVISTVVMTSATVARIYAKAVRSNKMGLEEFLSIFALITIIIWTILFDIACHLGVSKHHWDVRASVMPRIMNYLNICDLFYGPMLGTAKFSILLQLRRHYFAQTHFKKRTAGTIYVTGCVIFGYYFSCIFQFAFQCMPRKGLWDSTVGAKCSNEAALTFAAAAFGLLTDLMLYVLFLYLMVLAGTARVGGWRTLVPINITALFGISTAVATLYYRVPLVDVDADVTFHVGIVGIWAMAEYTAIILIGCIPSFEAYVKTK